MNCNTYLSLAENKLSIELSNQYAKVLGKIFDDRKLNKSDTYSKKGLYIKDIFDLHLRILSNFETLCTIPIYLNNLPRKSNMTKHEIEKSKYYKYHLENHIIRITTIFDQLILFLNGLYELGIDPKKCSAEIVFTNQHTQKTKEVELLKQLLKSINGVKGIRNLILHRGEFNDEDLDDLVSRELLKRYRKVEDLESRDLKIYVILESYISKQYKSKKANEISSNNKVIGEFLSNFFTIAHKTFITKLKEKEQQELT